MAKVKLSLSAAPTFKALVSIPIPGGKSSPVEFTFKARTKDEFKAFLDSMKDREDDDVILDIASGWELEEAFTPDNIKTLTQQYIGAAKAIIEKYIGELSGARLGN